MNYKLIPITQKDYDFIYELKKKAYIKYVEEIWGWDEDKQKEYFKNFIDTYKKNIYLIKLNDEVIGFYNDEFLENGDYEIGNICIIPEYQGMGIGTKILKDILKEYEDTNILLQYFKQNKVGNLYTKLGFIQNGETNYHYQMIKKAKKI